MKKVKYIGKPKIIIPVGEAKPGTPLTPLLGPHGIDVPKFIEQFNNKTADINPGVEVVANIVKITKIKFEVFIKPTPLSRMIYSLNNETKNITIEQLYDILLLKKIFWKRFFKKELDHPNKITKDSYKMLASLRSIHNLKITTLKSN